MISLLHKSCNQEDMEILHTKTQDFIADTHTYNIYTAVFTALGTLAIVGFMVWIRHVMKKQNQNDEILRGIEARINANAQNDAP